MQTKTIDIKGMHCKSCEVLVEDKLNEIDNIKHVEVDSNKGTAEIQYEGALNDQDIERAVSCAGYCLGREEKPIFSKNIKDYQDLGIAFFLVVFLFLAIRGLGFTNLNFATGNNFNSLPVVFLIGITAGVSTCMALVGGLVLGAAARFAEKHPNASPAEKFKPHLFFNLGRIISYFIFGAIIGFAGSFFQLSNSLLGLITIAVGLVMLLLGAQLIEIFPVLKGVTFTLPKSIGRILGIKEQNQKEYSHKSAAMMGASTFFLPCGFTQAIQLFAISSGNPVTGALALGTFALGTAPGLLGVGGLTSIVKGNTARLFFRAAGLVVIFLAVFNLSNGYNLTGFNPSDILNFFGPPKTVAANTIDPNVTLSNGVQIVRMVQDASGYKPNSFTIKRNIPVKWAINSLDNRNCAASIVSQKLNIRASLKMGENIFEFTPNELGTIKFTCSMGMYQGVFNVVGDSAAVGAPAAAPTGGGSCGKGGCGCGGGKANAQPPSQAPAPVQQNNVQVIKTIYTYSKDIYPNQFTVKAGLPVRFEVEAKENGSGCMGSITIPGLTEKIDLLTAGKTSVFEFTPQKGTYQITCAMGVPRGSITVQ